MLGTQDPPTVDAAGRRLATYIAGVVVRPAVTQVDERGEVYEILDSRWNVTDDPIVYVYAAMVRPGRIKGWVYHKLQTDRIFAQLGFLKVVLYDLRPESPTAGAVNEIVLTERNRALVVIPPLVAHAVQNVGTVDASFVNMPTRPYRHDAPDKFRVDRHDVPYSFDKGAGW